MGLIGPSRVRIPPPPLRLAKRLHRRGLSAAGRPIRGGDRDIRKGLIGGNRRVRALLTIASRSHAGGSGFGRDLPIVGRQSYMCRHGRHNPAESLARGHHAPNRSRCATPSGRPCDCRPRYQAQVYSPRDRKTLRKTFGSLTDARAWRSETHTAPSRGTLRAPSRTTLEEAAEEWLRAAEVGVVRTCSGDPYKPSALRGYEQALRHKLLPSLGHMRLSAVTRNAVQARVSNWCIY